MQLKPVSVMRRRVSWRLALAMAPYKHTHRKKWVSIQWKGTSYKWNCGAGMEWNQGLPFDLSHSFCKVVVLNIVISVAGSSILSVHSDTYSIPVIHYLPLINGSAQRLLLSSEDGHSSLSLRHFCRKNSGSYLQQLKSSPLKRCYQAGWIYTQFIVLCHLPKSNLQQLKLMKSSPLKGYFTSKAHNSFSFVPLLHRGYPLQMKLMKSSTLNISWVALASVAVVAKRLDMPAILVPPFNGPQKMSAKWCHSMRCENPLFVVSTLHEQQSLLVLQRLQDYNISQDRNK